MINSGKNVFVSGYGAGRMEGIQEELICGIKGRYITIVFVVDDIKLFIPECKIGNYKIREISKRDELDNGLKIISDKPQDVEKSWTKRYRESNEKIENGGFSQECEVLRDMYYLKREGKFPPGEQKILIKVENMVIGEIMLVYQVNKEEAIKVLQKYSVK